MLGAQGLSALIDATWPCARAFPLGPFLLRDGQGGGKRVSAASLMEQGRKDGDIPRAEAAMRDMGQPPLFAIWPDMTGQLALDAALAQRGYESVDPCVVYHGRIDAILETARDMTHTYPHWPPLAIGLDIWQQAGIGPARVAVMARARGAKTAVLARRGDDAAGMCFVALAQDWAMLHALEVAPQHRRQGSAQNLIARAAHWARAEGAVNLGLVVTTANAAARALYDKLGMAQTGRYHYRQFRDR